MLTEIRDRSSGAFAWVIAALIIIPMAFWGVQEYASTEANPALAEFGDQKITQSQFRASLQNQQQLMRSRMGENVNEEFLASDAFKQNVMQRLVNRALLEQVASDHNYRVSNQQLAAAIKEDDLFQLDGEFNQDAYERFLISSQYGKKQFEDNLRQDLALQQVTAGYDESAIVLPDEVRELLEAQVERRSFDVATLRSADFEAQVSVSDEEIADYYAGNQASFMEPEKVSVQYIEVSAEDIAAEIEVDEALLRETFEQNSASYVSTAKRETRHILLTSEDGDEADQLAKAQDLVSQLRAGADFAVLAKQHSRDPGSAQNGGSLGMVEPGLMVPEFETAAFALEQDEISDPVKSPFGYHIIQVTDIQLPEQQSFEDVRFELLQAEKEQQAQEQYLQLVDQLRDLAFEQPDNLDAAAEQLNLNLATTELFSRQQGEGIAALPAVRNLAFSEEVYLEELNSEPLEIAEGQSVVLRKAEVQEAAPQDLAEVRDQIKQLLTAQKAAELATQKGDELLEKAKRDWSAISSDESLEHASHSVSLVEPNRAVAPQVLQQVSQMHLTDGIAKVVDRNNDIHIIHLRDITAGDVAGVSEQIKEATRRILAQRNGGSLLNTYIEKLQQENAPDINTELLN